MNITFLIGNGFDIGLGLKTRYENFYEKYCCPTEEDNANIKAFKNTLRSWQQIRDADKSKYTRYTKIVDWSDFERAFGKHSNDFRLQNKGAYVERFEHFVKSFNEYLKSEEGKVDYSDTKLIIDTMNKATTTYYHIRPGDKNRIQQEITRYGNQTVYNFVSFNYTKTVDECAEIFNNFLKNDSFRSVGKVRHIHGYVERNMIIGVDNENQIENPELSQDSEIISELLKPTQNQDSRTNYESDVISMINQSQVICVYGMSIGETDKKWWNIISKWLLSDSHRVLIILSHNENYDERFTFTQRRTVNEITNKYFDLVDLSDIEKEKIKDRIFVGINYDIFEMNLVEKECEIETNINISENVS